MITLEELSEPAVDRPWVPGQPHHPGVRKEPGTVLCPAPAAQCGSVGYFRGSHFLHACKGDGASIFHPWGRQEDLAPTRQGSTGLSSVLEICVSPYGPHPTGWVISGKSPALEPLFPPVQWVMGAASALACGSSETKLVTVV